jgi:hypothetical protein
VRKYAPFLGEITYDNHKNYGVVAGHISGTTTEGNRITGTAVSFCNSWVFSAGPPTGPGQPDPGLDPPEDAPEI